MDKTIIENLLKDNQNRHSDFQLENFVIKNKGNLWVQYKKALGELQFRYDEIQNHEAKKDQLGALKKNKKFKALSFFSKKRRGFLSKLSIDIRSNQKKIDNTYAEFNCILKIAKELKKEVGEVTDERRQQLELESWTAKGLKLAAIDILSSRTISKQTYEFIFSLPKDSQVRILKTFSSHHPMKVLGFSRDDIKQISPRKENQ